MFLKLTILFGFMENDSVEKISESFANFLKSGEETVLLNVDCIHSITPVKKEKMAINLTSDVSLVKYRTLQGTIRCIVVRESFEELESRLV